MDTTTTYQTIEGWGAALPNVTFEAWIKDPTPENYDQLNVRDLIPDALREEVLAAAVFDLGLNRFRLEVGPQVLMQNDNDDPNTINWDAFRFKWQDYHVTKWVLPLQALLARRGDPLVLYISYDLRSSLTPAWLLEPDEYAELAVATLTHLKQAYNLEPDYWSVLNEPGNGRPGTPELVAELIARTGTRIKDAGFRTRMSGPEVVTPGQITAYMQALSATPGALSQLGQLTYHLYWDPMNIEQRNEIRDWGRKLGVTTAQTEWLEGQGLEVVKALYLDLTEADASVWEQFGIYWTKNPYNAGGGGDYFLVEPDFSGFSMNLNAWYLRQYMNYIRPGAVRVEVASSDAAMMPVAFLASQGKVTVVVINSKETMQDIHIQGLSAGTYGVVFTAPGQMGVDLPSVTVEESTPLVFQMPAEATATFYPQDTVVDPNLALK